MSREAREFLMPIKIGDPVNDAAMLKGAAPVEDRIDFWQRVEKLLARNLK